MAEERERKTGKSGWELEEDLLEQIYSQKTQDDLTSFQTLLSHLNLTAFEAKRLLAALEQKKDILLRGNGEQEPDIVMTEKGKSRALSILKKRAYLTSFLQMVCNVDEATARTDAHRIEHVASAAVTDGIQRFVRDRRIASRVIRNKDLSFLYEPGTYTFDMGLYESGAHDPRRFCKENEYFQTVVSVRVQQESWFRLETKEGYADLSMWYRNGGKWRKARKEQQYLYIASDSLEYTISGALPCFDADGYVVFPGKDGAFSEQEIRGINIHLW